MENFLPFYWNAGDIGEDIKRTCNDRPPYKRELEHSVESKRLEVEPKKIKLIHELFRVIEGSPEFGRKSLHKANNGTRQEEY